VIKPEVEEVLIDPLGPAEMVVINPLAYLGKIDPAI